MCPVINISEHVLPDTSRNKQRIEILKALEGITQENKLTTLSRRLLKVLGSMNTPPEPENATQGKFETISNQPTKTDMSIKLLTKNGRIGLVAECDLCGERVTAANGNVIWAQMEWKDGERPDHYIGCKENSRGIHCSRAIERSIIDQTGDEVGMTCLDVAICELSENVNLDREAAERRMMFLGSII